MPPSMVHVQPTRLGLNAHIDGRLEADKAAPCEERECAAVVVTAAAVMAVDEGGAKVMLHVHRVELNGRRVQERRED